MVASWITILVLAFGILVAAVGVTAFLRMHNKEKGVASSRAAVNIPPPAKGPSASHEEEHRNVDGFYEKK
ncbi:hypothetical protein [Paenibacillus sp. NPDC058071]|uniref:hypothetical protein n=1 Tax=Paenibacillus sp. NPDC058071 TaxID=3346326 RepID=UPI0036D78394